MIQLSRLAANCPNGQEVISYKESVSMNASDAKGYNFNFPTFKVRSMCASVASLT